jgi:uncharacterized protein YutE (UPF0331/DUF86 family)
MEFDKERINSRLSMLAHYRAGLAKMLPKSLGEYKKAGHELRSATERDLQVISEAQLDIASSIYKAMELKPSGTEDSLINALRDVFGEKLTEKMRLRRKLRNELVHAYSDIDDDEAYKLASDTNDLDEFEKHVMRILKEGPR